MRLNPEKVTLLLKIEASAVSSTMGVGYIVCSRCMESVGKGRELFQAQKFRSRLESQNTEGHALRYDQFI